jgi:putative oxidoreductase
MSNPGPGGPLARFAPVLLSALRIVATFLYMEHGAQKLFAFPSSVLPTGGTVPLYSLFGFAGLLEVLGGALLLLGLFTQPIAFLLSGEMAVAYFMAHAPGGFWPVLNHGEPAVLYCFIFLYLAAAGGGSLSLDALGARRANVT